LPIEEVLFFITVPYSCLFVWESINYFKKEEKIKSKFLAKKAPLLIAIIFLLIAMVFVNKEYTLIALLVSTITIIAISTKTTLFENKNFYYFLLITLGLFLIFNYILTSIPIVTYDSNAITNFRILTIPIEDSLFNFSMLTIYLSSYLYFKKKK
jgi:lycopene cyclase domain-containing protein